MNVKSKALRVLGIIGAVLLSIPLVVMLVAAPLYSVTASIITPQTVTQAVQNIDYTALLADSDALQEAAGAEHLPSEMMEEVMNSPFVEEVLTVYTEEVVNVLKGEQPTEALSKDKLLELVDKHMDDLLVLMQTYRSDVAELSEEELRTHIRGAAESLSDELLGTLPDSEDIQDMVLEGTSINAVSVLVSTGVPLALYGGVILLAGLIFLCLLHRFRGLLCLGIDALVALIPLLAAYSLLREGGLLYTQIVTGSNAAAIASLLGVVTGNLLIAVILIAVVGLALIAGYIAYTARLKKKEAGALPAPVAETPTLPQE